MLRNVSETIEKKLSSGSPGDRFDGLLAIDRHHLQHYLDRVIDLLLHDSVESVRERAAWTLNELNDASALPALIEAIHDSSWKVRSGAGWALVRLGGAATCETQRILAESPNPDAREMATLVLQRIR